MPTTSGSTPTRPGYLPLREAIARQLALSRGVTATSDEVLVTYGTQQALDLVTRVLVAPGDVVAVEEPGYPLARDVFASYGARVVPVRVDDEGLVVDELPAAARLVFTTPSHQFPTGPPLSLDRRRALLDFAGRHRCAVIEDDYDSEFRFTERPLETLHSMDDAGRVLYLGTFSKSLVPGLRFGYLVAPEPLQDALRAALQLSVGYVDVPVQAALARFLEDGLFARHLRKARAAYAERRDLVLEAIHGPLSRAPRAGAVPGRAARHHAAARPVRRRHRAWSRRAAERGRGGRGALVVRHGGTPRGIVLGYGAADTASIRPGLARLAAVLDATPSTPARPAPMSAGPSRWVPVSASSPSVATKPTPAPRRTQSAREQPQRGRRAHHVDQREGAGRHQQRRVEREVADGDHRQRGQAAERDHGQRAARDLAGGRALRQPAPAASRRGPAPRRAGRRRRSRR